METDDTKSKIMNCFLDLLKEKPYDSISISDITNGAELSRQTFYYHFENMFDVVTHCIAEVRDSRRETYNHESLLDNLVEEAQTIASCRRIATAVYNSRSRPKLQEYIFKNSFGMAYNHFSHKLNTIPPSDVELTCRFLTHAYTGLSMEWIEAGLPDTLPDIAKVVRTIVNYVTLYGPGMTPGGSAE